MGRGDDHVSVEDLLRNIDKNNNEFSNSFAKQEKSKKNVWRKSRPRKKRKR